MTIGNWIRESSVLNYKKWKNNEWIRNSLSWGLIKKKTKKTTTFNLLSNLDSSKYALSKLIQTNKVIFAYNLYI